MNPSSPFILRPVMTTLIMLTLALSGIFAFFHLPINDLPNIEKTIIEIATSYSGASALTVLNQVTTPLEKELIHVKEVHEMASYSSLGISKITLTFDITANMDAAMRQVHAAINRVETELPSDADRPTFHMQEGGSESILYILLNGEHKKNLEAYAETHITPRLSRVGGVAKVKVFGASPSLILRLNPEIMAVRNISFNQVVDTLKQHLSDKPLGSIQASNRKLYLELSGTEKNEKNLGDLLIGNGLIRLKDVGEFSYQSKQERETYFASAGQITPTLLFGVQKVRGANTVAVAKGVEKVLAELKNELPPSYQLNLWFNKAVWIKSAIHEVEWSLVFALVLVIFVIYLSLGRFVEALIPSLTLPLSLLGTLAFMYFANFSLDLLSLLALTLSVGFVVDDAIVVVENIVRHREKGKSPLEASLSGTKEISFTILSMTLSLVAVFIPLLFMGGMNGQLFREFSMTMAVAILISGCISLTLTPLLCSRLLSISEKKEPVPSRIYSILLTKCLKYPLPVLIFAIASTGASYVLFTKLSLQLLPDEDRGFLIASSPIPSSAVPREMQDNLNQLILKNSFVDNFLSIRLDEKLIFLIRLKAVHPPQNRILRELQTSFNQVPGVFASIAGYQMINLDFDLGSSGKYKYVMQGSSFEDVEKAADALQQTMRASSLFTSAKASQDTTPKLEVSINEGIAGHYGLTKQQIQELLGHVYGQTPVGYIHKGVTKTPVLMELVPGLASLSKLSLTSKNGTAIRLKTMATWEEKTGSFFLYHLDHLPAATLRFSLEDSLSPRDGLRKMDALAKTVLPHDVRGKFIGAAQVIEASQSEWIFLLLFASLAMYAVLGILYESFIHPLTILSSIPFAGLGGILTLFLFNEPLSLFSAVGFLLLIGIVKKNGIMIVDYAIEQQKKGLSPEEAIYKGCLVRFRPIMMTTFAAVMGALPLTFAPLHRGLGLVIAGGLVFSQGLTLLVTPVIYLYFERLGHYLRKRVRPGKSLFDPL